jgi:hypothetical protein
MLGSSSAGPLLPYTTAVDMMMKKKRGKMIEEEG